MRINSTKPYFIRSIYEWCMDNGFTPYISVKVFPELDIPAEYVNNGEIVFNIGVSAVQGLVINNQSISFSARFNGISRSIHMPLEAVKGIFAREINKGIEFSEEEEIQDESNGEQSNCIIQDSLTLQPKVTSKPILRVIK